MGVTLTYKDIMDTKNRLNTSKILPDSCTIMQKKIRLAQILAQQGLPIPPELMIWDDPIPDTPTKWKSSYDPYTKKEPTMKPLFQFTTVKPDAVSIWNTLSTHEIIATSGYTVDEIRFYMFVTLQLRTDFKSAKELCNNYESRTAELKTAMVDLLDLNTEQSLRRVRVPPADMPQWVHPELYIPYYMLKQLSIEPTSTLWQKLFDRTENTPTTADEYQHLLVDADPISKSITAFKLWYYDNDIIAEKYSDIFEIVNHSSITPIYGKEELIRNLNRFMYDHLTDLESHIYDYTHKLSIPTFKLGVSDAPQ